MEKIFDAVTLAGAEHSAVVFDTENGEFLAITDGSARREIDLQTVDSEVLQRIAEADRRLFERVSGLLEQIAEVAGQHVKDVSAALDTGAKTDTQFVAQQVPQTKSAPNDFSYLEQRNFGESISSTPANN